MKLFHLRSFCLLICFALFRGVNATAQNGDSPIVTPPAADTVPAAQITVEEMVRQGGPVLMVIIALGFLTLMITAYFFLTITTRREAPAKLARLAREQLRAGDVRGAYQMVEGRDELLARVLASGLKVADHDRFVIQEAMESEGERGATALWQKVSYLNNIGVIAPLLGLLGTVWGMIGAFNAIATESAQVKGISMAYSVSQAMITTAAGLVLAIPAMVLFYYFRGRVVKIVARIEAQAAEFVDLILKAQR